MHTKRINRKVRYWYIFSIDSQWQSSFEAFLKAEQAPRWVESTQVVDWAFARKNE